MSDDSMCCLVDCVVGKGEVVLAFFRAWGLVVLG